MGPGSDCVFFVGASEFMLSAMLGTLAHAYNASTGAVSWVVFSYALAYSIAAPVCGYLADRFNRRTMLLFSLIAFCIDAVAIAFAPNLSIAIILRIFGGVASAIIIPNAFALVSELTPKHAHAKSMGLVMLGMTFGIALGPVIAGILTELTSWRAPFVVVALGCICAFGALKSCVPLNYKTAELKDDFNVVFKSDWYRKAAVLRPLLAKGIWNGSGVAAFLLVGQTLQDNYDLGVAYTGAVITLFGLGLGAGNLLVPFLQKSLPDEESLLVLLAITVLLSVSLFFALSSLYFSLLMLFLWGAALGAAAPCSSSILVLRSGKSKGEVLSFAETLNNIVILLVFPVAAHILTERNYTLLSFLFGALLITSTALCLMDARVVRNKSKA